MAEYANLTLGPSRRNLHSAFPLHASGGLTESDSAFNFEEAVLLSHYSDASFSFYGCNFMRYSSSAKHQCRRIDILLFSLA